MYSVSVSKMSVKKKVFVFVSSGSTPIHLQSEHAWLLSKQTNVPVSPVFNCGGGECGMLRLSFK